MKASILGRRRGRNRKGVEMAIQKLVTFAAYLISYGRRIVGRQPSSVQTLLAVKSGSHPPFRYKADSIMHLWTTYVNPAGVTERAGSSDRSRPPRAVGRWARVPRVKSPASRSGGAFCTFERTGVHGMDLRAFHFGKNRTSPTSLNIIPYNRT